MLWQKLAKSVVIEVECAYRSYRNYKDISYILDILSFLIAFMPYNPVRSGHSQL